MKHLTLKLSKDAARTFAQCIKSAAQSAASHTANVKNNYPALTASVLNELLFKMSKQLWTERPHYKFSISLQDKLALLCAWDDGHLISKNEWTLNLLRDIISQIDQKTTT